MAGKRLVPGLPFNVPFRRFARDFSWALFGNLFVFEIVIFLMLSFFADPVPAGYWAQGITLLAMLVTFPATWRYREADRVDVDKRRLYRVWRASMEHIVVYIIAYTFLLVIAFGVGLIPMPR